MASDGRKARVAFIGTGLMGSRMAARLLDAGHPVTVRNRSPEKVAPLVARGARDSASVADAVADAEVVITSLAGADAIDEVYFGAQGIVPNAPRGSLLVDTSSLGPELARAAHRRLAEAGYPHHLDAPVSGGVGGAEAGTLSIMVGGAEADVARAGPVLDVLGNVFHLGGPGAGQVCKMINQTIVHIYIGAVTEGLMLAAAQGVDAGKVRDAIEGGFCRSLILENHGARMVERNFVPGGPLEYSVKDLHQAVETAGAASLELPLAQSVLEGYRRLAESGRARLDHIALLLAYEEANTPIRVSPDKADTLP